MNNNQTSIPEEVTLSRNLGLFTITMIGVGGMIGAGIFVLTGIAAGVAGPALVLVFLLNGMIALITGMAYAELGSAFPEAGGGYLWVKEGLGGTQGFLAGWMSWFAHVVAGSLYALGFGRFGAEVWLNLGLPSLGLSVGQMTIILTTMIIALLTYINYRGSSEAGTIGNIVTVAKILILVLFVIFGLAAMFRTEHWTARFTDNFMPTGWLNVLVAMGLTFIAFEGYEIIAQSGEEVIEPYHNVPRAIFFAIGIAVTIYLLVSIASIGAVTAPAGMQPYQYLGLKKELAVIEVAQQTFPWGIGYWVLLISGLFSTMSALNATTYSSSRVSFAMGRDRNLPEIFSRIHPTRHTPYWAVLISGGVMLLFAWLLPIESVAAAADIMFLLLFLQVNLTLVRLRTKLPDLKRGFRVPWVPFIPILGLVLNGILAITLFQYAPMVWFIALGWIIVGMLAYYAHFSKIEAMETHKEVLLEEVLVSRDFSVLIPVVDLEQARILGNIGAIIAQANQGELMALNVINVPAQMSLSEGRVFLKEGRPLLDMVIEQAKKRDAPVHTIIRLGRDTSEAIQKTVQENASNLILLGWPGYTHSPGKIYGSVIDPILKNPPADIAMVRYRTQRLLQSILVPVSGGPNSHRAVKMAINMAAAEQECEVQVVLLNVVPTNPTAVHFALAEQAFKESLEGLQYNNLETRIVENDAVADAILNEASSQEQIKHDFIIIGASEESRLHNFVVGSIPEKIANSAKVTVIILKKRSHPIISFYRLIAKKWR